MPGKQGSNDPLTTDQKAAIAAELANLEHGTNRFKQKVEGSNDLSTITIEQAALDVGDELNIKKVESQHGEFRSRVISLGIQSAQCSRLMRLALHRNRICAYQFHANLIQYWHTF